MTPLSQLKDNKNENLLNKVFHFYRCLGNISIIINSTGKFEKENH